MEKKLPIPRVQVRKFRGKNGGFAIQETTQYRCELVGVNGKVRQADQNNSWGHREITYALQEAEDWAALTGWPIIRVSTKRNYTEILELHVGQRI